MRRATGGAPPRGRPPRRKVEGVEDESVGEVRPGPRPDPEVAVPGHGRVARLVTTTEAPHRDALEAAPLRPRRDRPVVPVPRGEARACPTPVRRRYSPTAVYGNVNSGYTVTWSAPSSAARSRSATTSAAVCPGSAIMKSAFRPRSRRRRAGAVPPRRRPGCSHGRPCEVARLERLDAERDQRDPGRVQSLRRAPVHVRRVRLDAHVAGDAEPPRIRATMRATLSSASVGVPPPM